MKKLRKPIEGYVSVCIGYMGEGTICTAPNNFGAMRRKLGVDSDNTIQLDVNKKGKLLSNPELKMLYAIYKKSPSKTFIDNMHKSNDMLKELGRNLENCVYRCIIPRGSFVEKGVEVSEVVGIKEKMILSNNIILGEKYA